MRPFAYVLLVGILALVGAVLAFAVLGTVSAEALLGFAGLALIQLVNLYKTVQTQHQTNGELDERIANAIDARLPSIIAKVLDALGIDRG